MDKVIFFATEGMRQDMIERYVSEGFMPAYAQLMAWRITSPPGPL